MSKISLSETCFCLDPLKAPGLCLRIYSLLIKYVKVLGLFWALFIPCCVSISDSRSSSRPNMTYLDTEHLLSPLLGCPPLPFGLPSGGGEIAFCVPFFGLQIEVLFGPGRQSINNPSFFYMVLRTTTYHTLFSSITNCCQKKKKTYPLDR